MPEILSRILFIEYQSLKRILLERLPEVCTKAYIFVHEEEAHIPLDIVQGLQTMGKRLKWKKVTGHNPEDMYIAMAFEVGQLHVKKDDTTSFAFLYESNSLSSLITQLQASGRECSVVGSAPEQQKAILNELDDEDYEDEYNEGLQTIEPAIPKEEATSYQSVASTINEPQPVHAENQLAWQSLNGDISLVNQFDYEDDATETEFYTLQQQIYLEVAGEIIRQLVRSGDRPPQHEALRQYIYFQNPELGNGNGINSVINALIQRGDIHIEKGVVSYNF